MALLLSITGQGSPFVPALAAQSEADAKLDQSFKWCSPVSDHCITGSTDGNFSFEVLSDGEVQGTGIAHSRETSKGECPGEGSAYIKFSVGGSFDPNTNKVTLTFYNPQPPTFEVVTTCGGWSTKPHLDWEGNEATLELSVGAVRQGSVHLSDPDIGGVEVHYKIEIKQVAGIGGGGGISEEFDFSISVMDTTLTVSPGNSVVTTVTVYLEKGTAQPVTLKVGTTHTELLKTIKVSLSKITGNPNFASDLTIITSPDTPQGTFTITVVGEGDGITRNKQLTLVIGEGKPSPYPKPSPTPAEKPDFTLSVLPASGIEVSQGESASWTIKINWRTSPERVYLEVKSDPPLSPWHKITLQPKDIQEVKVGTATLTVQTKPNPTKVVKEVEAYKLTITAKAVYSGVTRSESVTLVVTIPQENFDFVILSDGETKVMVYQGQTASFKFRVKALSGTSKPVILSIGGPGIFDLVNKGGDWNFNGKKDYLEIPDFNANLFISTTDQTPPGTYSLTIKGLGGNVEKSLPITLEVLPFEKEEANKVELAPAPPAPSGPAVTEEARPFFKKLLDGTCEEITEQWELLTSERGRVPLICTGGKVTLPTGHNVQVELSKEWMITVAEAAGTHASIEYVILNKWPQYASLLVPQLKLFQALQFTIKAQEVGSPIKIEVSCPEDSDCSLLSVFAVDENLQFSKVLDYYVDEGTKKIVAELAHNSLYVVGTYEPESDKEPDLVNVVMKHKKKVTLVSIKNNGDEEIFGVQMKMHDGNISFVKGKGWDRDRIDQSTIIVQTDDRPIKPGRSLIFMLVVDNRTSSFQWTVLDNGGKIIAEGDVRPES